MRPVVYFHGCAANYYEPEVAKAIVDVLEHNGFEVLAPPQNCCGLPMQSNGDFGGARVCAEQNIRKLLPYAEQGIPIVVGGTSCGQELKADYGEILGIRSQEARTLAASVYDINEFLWLEYEAGRLKTDFATRDRYIPCHTSCHQKLHRIGRPALDLLGLVPGLRVEEMGFDCCGITGTYGYKHEKYEIAQAVGRPLFETIRGSGADLAICDNETCRWNIAACTGVRIVHTMQVLADAYDLRPLGRRPLVKILVVGAGAVGCFLGARLALAGNALTLVGRESVVQAVNAGGLVLEEPDGVRQATGVAAATSIGAALADRAPYDLALITVKAYDTDAVATELAQQPALPPLLTLQNGVGNEEAFAERVGEAHVLSGAIDTPVSLPAPGRVRVHRARYKVGLAPVGQATPALPLAGVAVSVERGRVRGRPLPRPSRPQVDQAADEHARQRLLRDPRLDPGTGHGRPGYGPARGLAWQEAMNVIAAMGVRPVRLAGYPFPLLLPVARRVPARWLAYALRGFVSGGRGSKMPSLQIALSDGKPSEVDWLNGAVARHGPTAAFERPRQLRARPSC